MADNTADTPAVDGETPEAPGSPDAAGLGYGDRAWGLDHMNCPRLMAVRPDRLVQHDDGTALACLEARLSRVIGGIVGELIAESEAIDEPFCRQLARATEPCAGDAEIVDHRSERTSYLYQIADYDYLVTGSSGSICRIVVSVAVALYDDGDVAVSWRHPAPHLERGYRNVHARTEDGFRFVDLSDTDPMIADAAQRLLTEIQGDWADYRGTQTAACMAAA